MAKRAVQTAKSILQQRGPDVALLNYRNTKHSSIGMNRAEALMGHKLEGQVPVVTKLLVPTAADWDSLATKDKAAKEQYKHAYNQRHGARELPPLVPGQFVLVKTEDQQHWTVPGTH